MSEDGGNVEAMLPIAKRYKHRMVFTYVGWRDSKLMEYLAVTEDMLPTLVVVDTANHQTLRYHMQRGTRATTPAMAKHVEAFLDGQLTPHFRSEPEDTLGEDARDPVSVLVGSNYKEQVLRQDRGALVMVYAPWCGHSKRLGVVLREVAEHFVGRGDLLVAKMDGTKNEVEGLDIHGYPTLKVGKSAAWLRTLSF